MKVTLLVMTLNEIEGMRVIMPQIPKNLFDQILICDGGSTDGTIDWSRENGYEVYVQSRPGIRFGYFEVWPHVRGDAVVFFSPDGNSLIEKLEPLVVKIKEGCDMVIVSRYLVPARSYDDNPITRFGNWLFRTLINFCFTRTLPWRYTDPMVIFRALRKDLPERLGLFEADAYEPMERWFRTTISWEPLMSIRAARAAG
jgi:glycosyltransferase involved in cell wall biosynthesis